MFLSSNANGNCPNGYSDIDPGSRYCFLVPYLSNNPINKKLHPNNGKTWVEAQQECQNNAGGQLAAFKYQHELDRVISFFENIYVIREWFRDYTEVYGVYFPGNATLCPEPPIGCALWYFGLKRENSTNEYR